MVGGLFVWRGELKYNAAKAILFNDSPQKKQERTMTEPRQNWAGNYTYHATAVHYPETIEQVQETVRRAAKIKALGSTHSFHDLADTTGDQVSLAHLNFEPEIDPVRHTVTVNAGAKYGQICEQLDRAGYALPNLASLPHISIAGATATATHGSGIHNGNLATAVSAIEFVAADGELRQLSREKDGDTFAGAVVSLGGLGVITRMTLDLVPAFKVRQDVYENLPLGQLPEHLEEIEASAYSISLFTDWRQELFNTVWLKSKVAGDASFEAPPELFGAKRAAAKHHPIEIMDPVAATPQFGEVGPWYNRLPHFRMDLTPSSGEEIQTEYLIPRRHAVPALEAVSRLREKIAPLLYVCEVRMIAADDLWMSPFYKKDGAAIHFTWKRDWENVRLVLPEIEAALEPFEALPHWGKVFTMAPRRVMAGYPRLNDFRALLRSYDPQGKFRNAFLDTYIFGE